MPKELAVATRAAAAAGKVLLEYYEQRGGAKHMKSADDFSTDADHAAEAVIVQALRKDFPDYNILTEEAGTTDLGSPYTWIIDPLDGTHNFSWGIPFWTTAIALEHRGTIIAAVTHDPLHNTTFTAKKGGGAFLNSKQIHVSSRTHPGCMLAFGSVHAVERLPAVRKAFERMVNTFHSEFRILGSMISVTSGIAAGMFDAYVGFDEKPWDAATGLLMVTEAGGRATDIHGKLANAFSRDFIFSNNLLHDTILNAL